MREVRVLGDADALAAEVAVSFVDLLVRRQAEGATPNVALTGGTIADRIHAAIAAHPRAGDVDWTRVVFWWGDERFVAPDSEDRNALRARRFLLDPVGAAQVHEIPDTSQFDSVELAATAYGDKLRAEGSGEFDLVMLGLGPDGHVASLFPGFPQLDIDDQIAVGVTDSPKPPPQRVSLTFAALNRTSEVWFVVSGQGKAEAVAQALAEQGSVHQTPARGISADALWFLDDEAASAL